MSYNFFFFREWCSKHVLNFANLVQILEKKNSLKITTIAIFKGRNGMRKKRMHSKRLQIKSTLNVSNNKIEKRILPNITFMLNVVPENGIIFV